MTEVEADHIPSQNNLVGEARALGALVRDDLVEAWNATRLEQPDIPILSLLSEEWRGARQHMASDSNLNRESLVARAVFVGWALQMGLREKAVRFKTKRDAVFDVLVAQAQDHVGQLEEQAK